MLDEFTSDEWRPSPRNLPERQRRRRRVPQPAGPGAGHRRRGRLELQLAPNFGTTWLPLPYPIRELDVGGGWRYDSRTLDVAYVGGGAADAAGLRRDLLTPAITAELRGAAAATAAGRSAGR